MDAALKTGNGSEYRMIDVANGVSQVQHNGTSLHNSANAGATVLVDQRLAKGLEPSEIFHAGLIHRSARRGHPQDRSEDAGQWSHGVPTSAAFPLSMPSKARRMSSSSLRDLDDDLITQNGSGRILRLCQKLWLLWLQSRALSPEIAIVWALQRSKGNRRRWKRRTTCRSRRHWRDQVPSLQMYVRDLTSSKFNVAWYNS